IQSRRASRMTSLLEEYSPTSTARRTSAAISEGSAMLSFSMVGMRYTSVVINTTTFLPSQPLQVLLNLHHEAGNSFVAGHQHLMRYPRRDVRHIPGSQFLARAALDRDAAYLSRPDGFRPGHRAAGHRSEEHT